MVFGYLKKKEKNKYSFTPPNCNYNPYLPSCFLFWVLQLRTHNVQAAKSA
jgi:hypothetical protein